MEGAISTQLPTQKFHTLISAKKNLTLEIENATNSFSKLRNFTNSFLIRRSLHWHRSRRARICSIGHAVDAIIAIRFQSAKQPLCEQCSQSI